MGSARRLTGERTALHLIRSARRAGSETSGARWYGRRSPSPADAMTDAARPPLVAITGGYLTANRGGAAMTRAVIDHVRRVGGSTELLTIYPSADEAQGMAGVHVVPWRPIDLLLSLPLALLMCLARLLRLPTAPLARTTGLRALHRADLVVDVAGISFVDGRGIPILGYNVLMTGIPLLVGTPVVKASQAVGPFDEPLNRLAARLVLPRVTTILARGDRTLAHLGSLGLDNVVPAADLAFSLEGDDAATARVDALVAELVGDEPFVAVMPSAVVLGYCDAHGIDYVAALAEMIRRITADLARRVLVVPHSIHPSGRDGRMHDVPVCRATVAAAGAEGCSLVDEELDPVELRALIARSDVLVSSRFHAMISGLATQTPTLVLGWSHKYAEVLRSFGLEDLSVDYSLIQGPVLAERVADLLNRAGPIRAVIGDHLPAVTASSHQNLEAIDAALGALGRDRSARGR